MWEGLREMQALIFFQLLTWLPKANAKVESLQWQCINVCLPNTVCSVTEPFLKGNCDTLPSPSLRQERIRSRFADTNTRSVNPEFGIDQGWCWCCRTSHWAKQRPAFRFLIAQSIRGESALVWWHQFSASRWRQIFLSAIYIYSRVNIQISCIKISCDSVSSFIVHVISRKTDHLLLFLFSRLWRVTEWCSVAWKLRASALWAAVWWLLLPGKRSINFVSLRWESLRSAV